MHTVAHHIASLIQAIENCRASGNTEWESRHARRLSALIREYMPSGAGWDSGTKLEIDRSSAASLVFTGSFHHMDANGMYDGWTDHTVRVTPAFDDVNISIGGRNRNDVKNYLHDVFHQALTQRVDRVAIDALYLKAD